MRFKSARFQTDDVRFIVLYKGRLDTKDYQQLVTCSLNILCCFWK